MDKANLWLTQAEEDLLWARSSLKEGILRGACFAAQQSAEKALKAFLLSKNITAPKIHDLVTLNQKCLNLEPRFKEIEQACNVLSPYYISSRYPDVAQFEHYSQDQAEKAVKSAEKIVNLVKVLLTV